MEDPEGEKERSYSKWPDYKVTALPFDLGWAQEGRGGGGGGGGVNY